ncbi:MAG: NADP-dependent malic enzyme [Candidatus Magasanikbacteria bacterium]|nr:NADP-dependent malic enzyme [Candidatus Magasanikbacteria bacterium]
MERIYKEALRLHKRTHGKLEIISKVPLETRTDLSRAYTPGVAQVSTAIGKQKSLARIYTIKQNTVAVVSDGSAILGLGNLGPEAALPVMEGKAALFKRFAHIDAFPICLATQDTEKIISTIKYIAPVFGGINLEDISAPRCFEIERRLQAELDIPVLHDDQHGTAVVVLAALINALKITQRSKRHVKIVINGAGAAGTAIAELLISYGIMHVVLCDSQGVIYKGRAKLNSAKHMLAEITNRSCLKGLRADGCIIGDLTSALRGADVFIGVSAASILKASMIRIMNKEPIIFAMANPIPEMMPNAAKKAGAAIVASGRSDFPNQINNVLAFPGIFRGALDHKIKKITTSMLLQAAHNLAGCVKNPTTDQIIPSIFDARVVPAITRAIL